MTPCKAIREYCISECQGTIHQVKNCNNKDCGFYLYRLGHNPKRKGAGRTGGNPNLNCKITDL